MHLHISKHASSQGKHCPEGDAGKFYILSKDGNLLMLTTRYRHIKNLIKERKVIKIGSSPFAVQMLVDGKPKVMVASTGCRKNGLPEYCHFPDVTRIDFGSIREKISLGGCFVTAW